MKYKWLGEFLFYSRKQRGLTLMALGRLSGVSHSFISQIENNRVGDVRFSIVVRLTRALGVSLEEAASYVKKQSP